MNREEEIIQAAKEYTKNYDCFDGDIDDIEIGFMEGAEWADKHPSYSLIVKIWNLAMEAAIAQLNREMPYFKSENEIKEYIKKHIRL
jgi:hypothetical protein